MCQNVNQIYLIGKMPSARTENFSIHDVNLVALAGIADAPCASGRGDLAAQLVETAGAPKLIPATCLPPYGVSVALASTASAVTSAEI